MKQLVLFGLSLSLFVVTVNAQPRPLDVVSSVDLSRYAGKWYEIARLPNRFQDHCTGNVSATYTVQKDGRIKVVNSCRTTDGTTDSAEGVARLASEGGPASKLKVRFAPAFLGFLPFVWGDYWILQLAPDYSHAVVGDPGRKYLWILARQPKIDQSTYDRLVAEAREDGFDVAKLIRTKQD